MFEFLTLLNFKTTFWFFLHQASFLYSLNFLGTVYILFLLIRQKVEEIHLREMLQKRRVLFLLTDKHVKLASKLENNLIDMKNIFSASPFI